MCDRAYLDKRCDFRCFGSTATKLSAQKEHIHVSPRSFTVEYQGYWADITFEPSDSLYHGSVYGLSRPINFEGSSLIDATSMFHLLVDAHLIDLRQREDDRPIFPYGPSWQGLGTILLWLYVTFIMFAIFASCAGVTE